MQGIGNRLLRIVRNSLDLSELLRLFEAGETTLNMINLAKTVGKYVDIEPKRIRAELRKSVAFICFCA